MNKFNDPQLNKAPLQMIDPNAAFTTKGRELADATARGQDTAHLVQQLTAMRQQEQDSADKATQFAALARLVGDANRSGRDTRPLLMRLMELRRRELTPAPRS